MVGKISKFTTIFALVLGISFSNIPFFVVSSLIDSYLEARNVVDKAWHISKDKNVIDKFTSYRHLAEKVRIYEAYAATLQYVGGAEASGNSAAYNVSLTSLTGGSGSSAQAGDLVIVATGFVATSNLNPGVGTAGYTEEVGGVDLYQNDSRDANFSLNWKIMGGSPDTAVNCLGSGSTTNGAVCVVQVWRNADQTTPMDITPTTHTSNNSAIPDCPSITPVTSGAVVICAGLGTGAANDTSVTAPTGYGNQVDISVDPGNAAIVGIASKAWSGSGAENPAAWTNWTTSTSDARASYTLAIRPANDPPTITVTQPDGTGDTVTVGDPYNITYDLADAEEAVTAAMYYDTDAVGLNGTAITGACATATEGTGATCSWDTTGMTPGTYYVYGITSDGINPQVSDYSSGVITINAPATTVTAASSGTQTANLDSGATNQYVGAVFTFQQSSGTVQNITALTISETGTVAADANLDSANTGIRWESGAATCTYNGTETFIAGNFNVSDQIAFSAINITGTLSPNFTCVYLVFDVSSSAAGGQTIEPQITSAADFTLSGGATKAGTYPVALSGTTTVRPNVTDPTDSSLADGGRNGDTFTITGAGFGTACASVSVQVEGTALTCNSANNTTISATIPSGQTTTFGGTGASGLLVTVGGTADDARQTFYVYPNVSSVTVCNKAGFPADAGREYDAVDSACPNGLLDGQVELNGTRFDSSANQGTVTFAGAFGSVSAFIDSWADTLVRVRVPNVSDSVYLGDIQLARAAATGSKTDLAYNGNGFRVLPRITGFTPASGAIGAAVTANGNHFCQNGGTCPSAFDVNNKVTFTSAVDATTFTSWSDIAMATAVPTGAVTGNVVLTSNGYTSNPSSFTVLVPTPNTPSSLQQSRNSGFTNLILTGGAASSTPVYFSMQTSSGVTGGTMYMQTELRPTTGAASSFSSPSACSAAACTGNAYCFEGTGVAYSGGTATPTTSTTTNDDLWHWQTRARYNLSGTDYCSSWQCYPDSGCNTETATDFELDTTAPVISSLSATGVTANAATIGWNTTGDSSSTQLAYGTDSALASGTATTTETDTSPTVTVHSVSLSNLSCGTTYYYRARSRDDAGITTFSSIQNFATSACPSDPAKTAVFHITGQTAAITSAAPLSQTFSVHMPETATTTKSAFVELTGIFTSGAASKDVAVQVNSEGARTYVLPPSSTSHFKLTHRVATVNATNTLTVTPEANTSIAITSARLIVTYAYTP